MPKPTLLPVLNWREIFAGGRTFNDWLAASEIPANRERIQKRLAELPLGPDLREAVAAIPRQIHVVNIAEDWCGDVVRHVPALERLAQETPLIQTRYITRDQHLDVFARFLTNGGEAIPKFIFLSADFVETGNWGPMPDECRRLIARGKALNNIAAARARVSERYAADPDLKIVVTELVELLATASATTI